MSAAAGGRCTLEGLAGAVYPATMVGRAREFFRCGRSLGIDQKGANFFGADAIFIRNWSKGLLYACEGRLSRLVALPSSRP